MDMLNYTIKLEPKKTRTYVPLYSYIEQAVVETEASVKFSFDEASKDISHKKIHQILILTFFQV